MKGRTVKMQNKKGRTSIWLIPLVLVLAAIITVGVLFLQEQMKQKEWETVSTDLLKVQARAKIVFERYHVDNANGLAGEKQEDKEALAKFQVGEEETYYKWNKETLEKEGLSDVTIPENEYYLVNYETEELNYSKGHQAKDNTVYNKLSEIRELEKEFES